METLVEQSNKQACSRNLNNNVKEDQKDDSMIYSISPQETATWLKVHQAMELPNHEVVFPWLHGYSMSSPPAYPDAISIIRSAPIINQKNATNTYLNTTGLLNNSMDPKDFLINWTDQIKYEPLKYNYDPTSSDIKQILVEIVTTETTKFNIPLSSECERMIIELCMSFRVLPFLKTDPYAWNKYCMKPNVKSSNNSQVSSAHSSTTTKNFQSHNFRRFDLQPSKMVELSSKLIVYCLNSSNQKEIHDKECQYCRNLAQLLHLALSFIKYSHQILDGKIPNNHKRSPHFTQKTYIITYDSFDAFPEEIVATPLLSTRSKDLKIGKDGVCPLASKFDIVTFNNWNSNLQYHEKLEMSKMSSATLVDDDNKVWCGNMIDYQILTNKYKCQGRHPECEASMDKPSAKHEPYFSPLNSTIQVPVLKYNVSDPSSTDKYLFNTESASPSLKTKLIIRCSDQSNLPTVDTLWTQLHKTFFHNINKDTQQNDYMTFNFPCSGSVGLGNLNINSIEAILNSCFLIWQVSKFTPFEALIYCIDGYTETTFLLVAYLIFLWDMPLQEVIYKLHLDKDRPFFLFQVDMQVLGHLQTLLRSFSPKKESNLDKYNGINDNDSSQHISKKLPLEPLRVDHEMFSSIFLMRLPELDNFIKLNGPLPSRILPHMYLGSLVHAHNPELLHKLGITHIVSVGENLSWVSVSVNNTTHDNDNNEVQPVIKNQLNRVMRNITRSRGISSPPKVSKLLSDFNETSGRTRGMTINESSNSSNKSTDNNNTNINNNDNEYHSALIDPELFSIVEQDGFTICKINNLEDNGKDPLTGRGQLNAVLEFIDECEQSGGKVLVHCMVGVSRSATVCIAECMKRLKVDLLRAYLYVRVRRLNIIIQPNLMFMYELLKWQESLVGVPRTIDWHIICKAIAELNRKYIN